MARTWFDPENPPFSLENAAKVLRPCGPFEDFQFTSPDYGKSFRFSDGSQGLQFKYTGRKVSGAQIAFYLRTGHWVQRADIKRRNRDPRDDRYENLIVEGWTDVSDLV